MMRPRRVFALVGAFLVAILSVNAFSLPLVPNGFTASVYTAGLNGNVNLAFGENGVLYVGAGGESTGPTYILRVESGGSAVAPYGNSPLLDPDAVAFDRTGAISGQPGSVIVGGGRTGIAAILPDQSVVTLFAGDYFHDIPQIEFYDETRMLVVDDAGRLAQVENGVLSTLAAFDAPPASVAVSPSGLVFVAVGNSIVLLDGDGGVVDGAFATALGGLARLTYSNSPAFGDFLYAMIDGSGNLYRFGPDGTPKLFASGFTPGLNFPAFGHDGALYVSDLGGGQILRIAGPPSYACQGFDDPFDVPLMLHPHTNRAIPLRAQLKDATGAIVDANALGASPPIVHVSFTPVSSVAQEVDSLLVPLGQSSIGNQLATTPRADFGGSICRQSLLANLVRTASPYKAVTPRSTT